VLTAVTVEQVKVGLVSGPSTPCVVEIKINGVPPMVAFAGDVAVTLKLNDPTLVVLPVGPPGTLDWTVQVWPTSVAQGTPGVPAITGVAARAIAVEVAAAACATFSVGVSVIVGVIVRVRVGVGVVVNVGAPVTVSV